MFRDHVLYVSERVPGRTLLTGDEGEMAKATGHLRIEDRKRGPRVWVATITKTDGTKTRTVLGPAWAKDSGRRRERGGVIWRAADGACPHGHLTPAAAGDALDALISTEKAKPASRGRVAKMTFGEAVDSYLVHAATVGGARGPAEPTTMRGYRSIAKQLLCEFTRDLPLQKVGKARVESYQERISTDLSPGTVRHRMLTIHAVLEHAVDRGWLGSNPADGVRIAAQPQPDPDFNVLEPSQVEAVARAIATIRDDEQPKMRSTGGERRVDEVALAIMAERRALYAEVVRIAAHTGLRFAELRALQWRDVKFSSSKVHVLRSAPASAPSGSAVKAPKSGKGRSVPLSDDAMGAFERVSRHLATHGLNDAPEALVFQTRDGGRLDDGRVRRAFYAGLAAVGLDHLRTKDNPMTFHDLRHTFGTIAVRVFPLSDVKAFMGHADIATTMRYVHHVEHPDAATKLSAAFASDLGPTAAPARMDEGAIA